MPEQISILNLGKGLKNDRLAFNLDNDAFPNIFNFYIWRGRAKRKRGTQTLGQLQIQEILVESPTTNWEQGPLTLSSGIGNLLVFLGLSPSSNVISNITQANSAVVTITGHNFSIGQVVNIVDVSGMTQINGGYYLITGTTTNTITINVNSNGFSAYTSGGLAYLAGQQSIVPGSITFTVGSNTYTENDPPNGTLIGSPAGTGTVNYATGEITITGGGSSNLTGTFSYYPGLPVMALPDFEALSANFMFPLTMAFDTRYSYQINQISYPGTFYNVNYFKSTSTPFTWGGADYQQFWITNYSGALWATNNRTGFNFLNGTYVSGTGTSVITFTFTSGGNPFTTLIVNDVLFFNEWASATNLNNLNGTVTSIVDATTGTYQVTFSTSEAAAGNGIAQMLTNFLPGQDGIKWYDGDPTGGTGLPTGSGLGWVNFSPPLTAATVSIDNTPTALYYLVGALAILPFKDRLLFFSPWIQTSSGIPIQLLDTILWSWNGTPYYNALTPGGETFNVIAYYVDQTGAGGYLPAGISQPIATISNNEDALLVGFGGDGRKTRFVYTGNDLQPFLFYNINSELPSTCTFSAIALDRGAIDIGTYGIALTDQQSSQRIDLDIPDEVFQIQSSNNGLQRVNALRDFKNEWIYFSYPLNVSSVKFPTQTFLYNYRDNTWGILYENYTSHGYYRSQNLFTWETVPYDTWETWNEPWDAGISSSLIPQTILGNPEGFVLIVGEGTSEAPSGTISAISRNGSFIQITSYNHCVQAQNPYTAVGDYIYITGCLGTTSINNLVAQIDDIIDDNNFLCSISNFTFPSGNYLGLGQFTRLSQPLLQTKQFNPYWKDGCKVFCGAQKYLLDYTSNGQITTNIYLNQDSETIYNAGSVIPDTTDLQNSSLIYSNVLYTSPELPSQSCFNQILGLIGNGIETTFMFDYQTQFNFNLGLVPGSTTIIVGNVATFIDNGQGGFTTTGTGNASTSTIAYATGLITLNFTSAPTLQLTTTTFQYFYNNIQNPQQNTQQQIWHRFNQSFIGDTFQIGITLNDSQMRDFETATQEITLHGMHLIVDRSSLLA